MRLVTSIIRRVGLGLSAACLLLSVYACSQWMVAGSNWCCSVGRQRIQYAFAVERHEGFLIVAQDYGEPLSAVYKHVYPNGLPWFRGTMMCVDYMHTRSTTRTFLCCEIRKEEAIERDGSVAAWSHWTLIPFWVVAIPAAVAGIPFLIAAGRSLRYAKRNRTASEPVQRSSIGVGLLFWGFYVSGAAVGTVVARAFDGPIYHEAWYVYGAFIWTALVAAAYIRWLGRWKRAWMLAPVLGWLVFVPGAVWYWIQWPIHNWWRILGG